MSEDADDRILEWPDFSDGSSDKWPAPPYVRSDSTPAANGWLQKLGQAIATVSQLEKPERYRMNGWPAAYAVFALPRAGTNRADHYLYGGPKKYRSAMEFQDHAVWLYFSGNPPSGYEPVSSSPSKRPQPSSSNGSPTKTPRASTVYSRSTTPSQAQPPPPSQPQYPPEHSPPPSSDPRLLPSLTGTPMLETAPKKASPSKKVTFRESPPTTVGYSTPTPVKGPDAGAPGLSLKRRKEGLHQRSIALLTIAPKEKGAHKAYPTRDQINRSNRTYRIGELVWCVLEPSLFDERSLTSIDQWPGLIEAYRVKKVVLSADAITEEEFYHVKLLALKDAFVVPGSRITPYKTYKPNPTLIALIQSLPPPPAFKVPSHIYHFYDRITYLLIQHHEEEEPADLERPKDLFLQATGAYALALQNAARLSLTWGFAYPQIEDSESDTWYHKVNMEFAGLWWGPELIYVGEMVLLISSRAHLAQHPTTMDYVQYVEGDEDRAVLLQIKRLKARSSPTGEAGRSRALVVGVLYELVPLLSDTPSDPVSTMPKQTAPLGMMWKQLLPPELEVCVDITLLSGRYYEDVNALPSEAQMQNIGSILQGLSHGVYGRATSPTSYYNTRAQMCRAAKTEAMEDLEQYWTERLEVA